MVLNFLFSITLVSEVFCPRSMRLGNVIERCESTCFQSLTSTHAEIRLAGTRHQDGLLFNAPRLPYNAGLGPRTSEEDMIECWLDGWGYHPSHLLLLGPKPAERLN